MTAFGRRAERSIDPSAEQSQNACKWIGARGAASKTLPSAQQPRNTISGLAERVIIAIVRNRQSAIQALPNEATPAEGVSGDDRSWRNGSEVKVPQRLRPRERIISDPFER
jgi:hypothetical protein